MFVATEDFQKPRNTPLHAYTREFNHVIITNPPMCKHLLGLQSGHVVPATGPATYSDWGAVEVPRAIS